MLSFKELVELIDDQNLVYNLDLTKYDLKKELETDDEVKRPIYQVVTDYLKNNKVNKEIVKEYYEHDYQILIDDRLFEEIDKLNK